MISRIDSQYQKKQKTRKQYGLKNNWNQDIYSQTIKNSGREKDTFFCIFLNLTIRFTKNLEPNQFLFSLKMIMKIIFYSCIRNPDFICLFLYSIEATNMMDEIAL